MHPIVVELTRQVEKKTLEELTGVDRTPLWWSIRSLSGASGQRLGDVGVHAIELHAAVTGHGAARPVILLTARVLASSRW